jgi:hypothetical protein
MTDRKQPTDDLSDDDIDGMDLDDLPVHEGVRADRFTWEAGDLVLEEDPAKGTTSKPSK